MTTFLRYSIKKALWLRGRTCSGRSLQKTIEYSWVILCPSSLLVFGNFGFIKIDCLSGIIWNLSVALIFIFFVDKDAEFFQKFLWVICISPFESYMFSFVCLFVCFSLTGWVILIWVLSLLSSLYMMHANPLSKEKVVRFTPICRLPRMQVKEDSSHFMRPGLRNLFQCCVR